MRKPPAESHLQDYRPVPLRAVANPVGLSEELAKATYGSGEECAIACSRRDDCRVFNFCPSKGPA